MTSMVRVRDLGADGRYADWGAEQPQSHVDVVIRRFFEKRRRAFRLSCSHLLTRGRRASGGGTVRYGSRRELAGCRGRRDIGERSEGLGDIGLDRAARFKRQVRRLHRRVSPWDFRRAMLSSAQGLTARPERGGSRKADVDSTIFRRRTSVQRSLVTCGVEVTSCCSAATRVCPCDAALRSPSGRRSSLLRIATSVASRDVPPPGASYGNAIRPIYQEGYLNQTISTSRVKLLAMILPARGACGRTLCSIRRQRSALRDHSLGLVHLSS